MFCYTTLKLPPQFLAGLMSLALYNVNHEAEAVLQQGQTAAKFGRRRSEVVVAIGPAPYAQQ